MRVNDGGDGGITTMPATDYLPKSSPSTADIQAWNNAIAGTGNGQGGGASTPAASTSPAPPPPASGEKASDDAASHAPSQPKPHKHHWYDRPLEVLQVVGGGGGAALNAGLLLAPDPAPSQARVQAGQEDRGKQTAPQNAGPSAGEVKIDLVQAGLDVMGILDPTPASDGSNAAISLFRGHFKDAFISTVSAAVPYLGDTAKLAKLPKIEKTLGKVAELVRANPEATRVLRGPLEKLGAVLDKVPLDKLPDQLRKPLEAIRGKLDEARAAVQATEHDKAVDAFRKGEHDAAGDEGKPPATATGGAGSGKGPIDGGGPHSTVGEPDDPGHLDGPKGANGGPGDPTGPSTQVPGSAASTEQPPAQTVPNSPAVFGRTEAEYETLARDPAQGGKITAKTEQERRVGLELEKRGDVLGPITRDPTGKAEFIDAQGNKWDVKGFNSNFKPSKGGFDRQVDAGKVDKSLKEGENVMLDTSKMTSSDVAALKAEGVTRGWGDKVVYWP